MMPCKKTYFSNEKIAMDYVARLQETSKRKVVPNRAYLCEKCLNWHITSLTVIKQNNMKNQIEILELALARRNTEIKEKQIRIDELTDTVVKLNNKIRVYDKQALEDLKNKQQTKDK
tara:strand:+ start:755 stop:1105 length:351 start_codon:yes stop_codon:yes gene_type:complete